MYQKCGKIPKLKNNIKVPIFFKYTKKIENSLKFKKLPKFSKNTKYLITKYQKCKKVPKIRKLV